MASIKTESDQHVFQALHYLRKLCSHPAMVLTASNPEFRAIELELRTTGQSLHDLAMSSKLLALKCVRDVCAS